MKRCQFCTTEIHAAALVCTTCGRDLLTPVGPRYLSSIRALPRARTRSIGLLGLGAAGLLLLALFGEACAPPSIPHAAGSTRAALDSTVLPPL